MTDFGDLFEPEPKQWGLRGDPQLWRVMREEFRGVALPTSGAAVRALLGGAFLEHSGTRLDVSSPENIPVPNLAVGSGMSDGLVRRDFWLLTALPLIVDRWAAAADTD